MSESRVAQVLDDLSLIAADAAYILGLGRGEFETMIVRRAAISVVIDVSSAIDRLPDSVRSVHPDIPWRAIAGMRNILAHDYRITRGEVIWATLAVDIPELVETLRTRLGGDAPSS